MDTQSRGQPHCSTSFLMYLAWRKWWWLPLLFQRDQTKTNWVSISFWFHTAVHMTTHCTSHKKKQELSLVSLRKALSQNQCREENCTNHFSLNKNKTCRVTYLAPEAKDKAGCGNCLLPWPRTQNHILSLRNDPLFFFLSCLLQTTRMVDIPLQAERDYLPCYEYHGSAKRDFSAAHN